MQNLGQQLIRKLLCSLFNNDAAGVGGRAGAYRHGCTGDTVKTIDTPQYEPEISRFENISSLKSFARSFGITSSIPMVKRLHVGIAVGEQLFDFFPESKCLFL